jgi:hypothetical protein
MRTVDYIRALSGLLMVCFLFTSVISRAFNPLDIFKSVVASEIPNDDTPVKEDVNDSQLFDEEEGEDKSEKEGGEGKFFKLHSEQSTNEFCLLSDAVTPSIILYLISSSSHAGFSGSPLYLSKKTLLL